MRAVKWAADSARFISIVERCSFDGASIHRDGGSPGDDSFPTWFLIDWCVKGGARDGSDL